MSKGRREAFFVERRDDFGEWWPEMHLPGFATQAAAERWACDGDRIVRYVPAKPKKRARRKGSAIVRLVGSVVTE